MIIEYGKKSKKQSNFGAAEPGTVAQFKGKDGPLILKLGDSEAAILSWSDGKDALFTSDGSIERNNPDRCEILGKLVGIIIE